MFIIFLANRSYQIVLISDIRSQDKWQDSCSNHEHIACVITTIRLAHNCPCQQSFMNGGDAHKTRPFTDELLSHGVLQFILFLLGQYLYARKSVKKICVVTTHPKRERQILGNGAAEDSEPQYGHWHCNWIFSKSSLSF